jgi:RsiW-degrading membrane proteinase PrsW (M82 family)
MEKALVFIGFNILSLLPILFWLFFFLWQDRKKPEPKKWLFGVYLSGFLIAPLIWLLETSFFQNGALFSPDQLLQKSLWLCFSGALIEESIKFLAVYLIIKRNTHCNESTDPIIYLVTGALGFASLENILAAFSFAISKTNFVELISLLGGRFLGANFLHALMAVIIGTAWGWGVKRCYSPQRTTKLIFFGLSLAILIHMLFNYSLITSQTYLILPIGGSLFLLAIIFLWFFQLLDVPSKDLKGNDFYK